MARNDDVTGSDYEQLRRHLQGPRREHPAGRQQPRAPIPPELPPGERGGLTVMSWLIAVGRVVVRRMRWPRSAMVRLHPKQ